MSELPIYGAWIKARNLDEALLRLHVLCETGDGSNRHVEEYHVEQVGRAYDLLDQAMQEMARARAAKLAPKPDMPDELAQAFTARASLSVVTSND